MLMCHWNRGINTIYMCREPGLMSLLSCYGMPLLLFCDFIMAAPHEHTVWQPLSFWGGGVSFYRTNYGKERREITREIWSCLACWFNKCYGLWQWGFYFLLQRYSDSSFQGPAGVDIKLIFSTQLNFSILLISCLTKLKMFSLTSVWLR